jgi:linoleoyl-CoA desaturase
VQFDGGGAFHAELRERVRAHLAEPGRIARGERLMILKTVAVTIWSVASWALLVFAASTWWQAGLLAVSLGLALAGVGFNVTHDANHGSFSRRPWLNRTMRWSLDLMGASSYVWRIKHNVVHHTYTNVSGIDDDIDAMPFARLAPDQPRKPFHRLQHIYLWPLYGLFAVNWHTTGDFVHLTRGSIGGALIRWPRGREFVGFWLAKAVFVAWAVVIPALVHPIWQVAVGFAIVSVVLAFTLAVTFQLAHCLEEAEFSTPEAMSAVGRAEWARHQVETTVDFAPRNHLLTWYLGGLNFQVEHHLFSRVCHVHYPGMAPIVRDVCARHGIAYRSHGSTFSALGSHARWLRRMGAAPAPA